MKYFLLFSFFFATVSSVSATPAELWDHGTLTAEQYTMIMSGAVYAGDPSREITLVEYADLECPFCIRHHNQTVPLLEENDAARINLVIKNNRGVNHPGTQKKAIAVLCVKKYGGTKAYYQSIHAIMAYDLVGNRVFPVGKLSLMLRKYIPKDSYKVFQSCIQKSQTLPEFNRETAEATALGLQGTPGFVVLNHKTREYVRIEWAYPYETFSDAIIEVSK